MQVEDQKDTLQPMMEVMAMAQVTKFPNKEVPLVNILASKTAFRPFIYFKEEDVLLSTPKVVPLRRNSTTIDIQGLILLFVILRLHKVKCLNFNMEKIK